MRLRVEPRQESSRLLLYVTPVAAVILTVLTGLVLFVLMGYAPGPALFHFFVSPLLTLYGLSELMVKAAPLIMIGADLVGRARTQREWSSQGVRNAMKKAPDNDKIRRKASAESSEKQAQKVRQMESRIARLEEVEEPRKEWQLEFTIGSAPRSSAVVSTLGNAVLRQGGFTLGPVTVQVNAGERIGITGPNGAGKSTLLRALLGRQAPDEGLASLGANVAIGEIDQARTLLAGTLPLSESFEALVPDLASAEARTLLAKFGLKADHVNRPVDALSPGERTRAALALLQARGVNLLVLDEPTNHLDLAAIEQLEQALESYQGTLLLVTHDRRMLDNVRIDRHWSVESGRLTES